MTLSKGQASAFEVVEVRARLDAGEHPVGPALVVFYDGDPAAGGEVFEVEHVPFIEAGASYLARVRYQPRTPGTHDLFAVVHAHGGAARAAASIEVTEPEPADSTCQNPLLAARLSGSIGPSAGLTPTPRST